MKTHVQGSRIAHASSGLTLLEVMLAVVVLGVALIPVSGLFTGAIFRAVRSQDITVATNIAQDQLERLKSLGYDAALALRAESPIVIRRVLGSGRRDYDVRIEIGDLSGSSTLLKATVRVYVSPLEEHETPVAVMSTYLHPNGV